MARAYTTSPPPATSGNAAGRAALALQLRRLADVEALPVYAEMRAAADDRRRAEAALPRNGAGKLLEQSS